MKELIQTWRRWSFPTKLGVVSGVLGIIGFPLTLMPLLSTETSDNADATNKRTNYSWANHFTSVCSGGFADPTHQTSSVSGIEISCAQELSCSVSYEFLVLENGEGKKDVASLNFNPREVSYVTSDGRPTQVSLECRSGESDCLSVTGRRDLLWKPQFPAPSDTVALQFPNLDCTVRFMGFLDANLK